MEAIENHKSFPEWATRLMIWVLPTAFLFLLALICCLSLNRFNTWVFITIPLMGLIITRLIFLFRSKRKPGAKIWRAVIWMLACAALVLISIIVPKSTRRIYDPQGVFEEKMTEIFREEIPTPMELGSPDQIEYHDSSFSILIFETEAYTLLCSYDEANYTAEKNALETRYSYRTLPYDAEKSFDGNDEEKVEPYTSIGDDHFRFVKPDDNDSTEYFTQCFIVVTNDVKHEIAYIVFRDIDLDVAKNLDSFLMNYCGWKHIR
ncbi:MAG: hypothetical protein IKP26_01105 [Clostridia bacterium]|nr:hypothetical protein [Clostridia bacterium]